MGVKDLWTILAPVKKHRPIASLKGQTIAIDLSVWVCESLTVKPMQGRVVKPHLRNLFFRVSNLLQLGIHLIFVIDGEAPELKWEEMTRRTQARYGASKNGKKPPQIRQPRKGGRSNFKVWLKECEEMLSYLGIPCVQSQGEAEGMCALLNSHKIADACLTEDGDAFLYGANAVYRNFTLNTKDPHVDCYSMTDIKQQLGLDRDKLIALALLLGCDYLPKGVVGVGKEHGCQLMKQLGDVDVLQRFKNWASGTMGDCSAQPAKPSHCRVCNHVGTGKQHKMHGCMMCGTHTQCHKQSLKDSKCSCTWHVAQDSMDISKLELDIMRKAMKTAGFPFQPVISEFMDIHDTCPSRPLRWKQPKLAPIQKFNLVKMEWPEDYSLEKVFPLMSLWHLTHMTSGSKPSRMEHLVLESFIKTRTRQGVSCIEVQWVRPDWNGGDEDSQFYNTIEKEEMLAVAYPNEYQAFIQGKELKKSKTAKGKGKTKSKAVEDDVDLDLAMQSQADNVDDRILEILVKSVQSLDISTSTMTGNKDTTHGELLPGQDTLSQSDVLHRTQPSQASKTTKPKRTHEKERLHSCPSQASLSQTGKPAKPKRTSEKGRLNSCPSQTSENSRILEILEKSKEFCSSQTASKPESRNTCPNQKYKNARKSANSSDINLLEDLLDFEASQSLVRLSQNKPRSSMTDSNTSSMINQVPDDGSDVESEVLPLFQRLRLRSVKGTSGKSNSKVFDVDREGKQNNVRTKQGDEIKIRIKKKLGKTRVSSSQRYPEVIVITSDSDDEFVVKEVATSPSVKTNKQLADDINYVTSDDKQQSQTCGLSIGTDLSNKDHLPKSIKENSPLSNLVERSQAQSDTTTASDNMTTVVCDLTPYLTRMIADETVTADYNLIQPDVTALNTSSAHKLSATTSMLPLDLCADETATADYNLIQPDISALNISSAHMLSATRASSSSMLSAELCADETATADYNLIQPDISALNISSAHTLSATRASSSSMLSAELCADETATADYKLIQPDVTTLNTLSATTSSASMPPSGLSADETATADYNLFLHDATSIPSIEADKTAIATLSTLEMSADETAIADYYKLVQPNVMSLTSSAATDADLAATNKSLSPILSVLADETCTVDYKLIQPNVTSTEETDLTATECSKSATACADETAATKYKLIQPDITTSTTTAGVNLTEQSASTICSSAIFADETATADYKLIQPELSNLSVTEHRKESGKNDATSFCSNPIVSLTSPLSTTGGETPLSSKSISKTEKEMNRNSNIAFTQALSNSVISQSFQSPNLTASSTNSFWCDDSQMSLFDSPSIMDSVHSFTENSSRSSITSKAISVHKMSTVGDSNLTADNSAAVNFSFPCVFDLTTPDIPEETPTKLDDKENDKMHSKKILEGKSSVENIATRRSQNIKEFVRTKTDIISPNVMELNTPDGQDTTYAHHPNESKHNDGIHRKKICENSKLPNAKQSTSGENTEHGNPGRSLSSKCYQSGNVSTNRAQIAPSLNPADITCIPEPLNCDTPDISLTDMHLSSGINVKTEVVSAQLDCKNQATPLSRNHHSKPHMLQMDNPKALCELTRNSDVVNSHSQINCDTSLFVARNNMDAKPLTNCKDQSARNILPNKPRTVRETVQQQRYEVENSPVCLLDRLRKKFDKCGDTKASLRAMTSKSQPRL